MRTLWISLLLLPLSITTRADEGMWLPQLLATLNEKDMKAMGMKIAAKDIYDVKNGSLKDAICQFGGGCTGEIISRNGLLLTNHHCGYDAITNHSTPANNILDNGFWAKSYAEEIPNEGLKATFIVDIKEVTNTILQGVTQYLSEADRQTLISQHIKQLANEQNLQQGQQVFIRPFFEGNQYYMFIAEVYEDVRLVGTPPAGIGQFGKDTDNWVWPRHTGDFSLFRIYTDANNKPSKYSPSNIPMKPKKFLNISLKGVKEGDYTMVMGFPGRTQQYLPAAAVNQIANTLNPLKVNIRSLSLAVIDKYMRTDVATKLTYADRYAGIANSWKKWQGEYKGLLASNAVAKKLQYEAAYTKAINDNTALIKDYADVLPNINNAYAAIAPYAKQRDAFIETANNAQLFNMAITLGRILNAEKEKGDEGFYKALEDAQKTLMAIEPSYINAIEQEIFNTLLFNYFSITNENFLNAEALSYWHMSEKNSTTLNNIITKDSKCYDIAFIKQLLTADKTTIINTLSKDKLVNVCNALAISYNTNVAPALQEYQPNINALQRQFMQAQIKAFPAKKFYADANSTLRVTYGKVKGYEGREAVSYGYYTYLDGVMEKYVPGDYEFDVPEKLRTLYDKKDFGRYAAANGKLPVAFIAANHTTGGNSGSPALDAYGNFVGINFDRVWEGTMSDLHYDVNRCRNIMVDARYILFIIEKYGECNRLINEMNIIPGVVPIKVVTKKVKKVG
jgi:hypothetical protein